MRLPAWRRATSLMRAGDPGVVLLDQAQLAHVVLAVGIEAGADEDHLGANASRRGIQ
jgi:hypothetical protein